MNSGGPSNRSKGPKSLAQPEPAPRVVAWGGSATLKTMISWDTIEAAVHLLAQGPTVQRVILFGSYAQGMAREDSDLDFLVIESNLQARREEMVRLRARLRPLGIPVDVMVADAEQFETWKEQPGSALFEAAHHGQVLFERAV